MKMANGEWMTPDMQDYFKTVASAKTTKEVAAFLRDTMTISEIEVVAARWKAAQLINEGMPYRAIAAETGMSTATITRIAHWMERGEGGYAAMLKRKK